MIAATDRQLEVLEFMRAYQRDNGMPPTVREIMAEFGFTSTNAVASHLILLAKKGLVRHRPKACARLVRVAAVEHRGGRSMKERPILFSAPMVRALLAGTKTQTRRLVGLDTLKQSTTPGYDWTWRGRAPIRSIAQQSRHPGGCWQDVSHAELLALCPYGAPGDRLWVRETFGLAPACHDPEPGDPDDWHVIHRATCEPHFEQPWRDEDGNEHRPPWRPSIFMPRWASRITLEVTEVRVERLHAITGRDVLAEGVDNGKSNPAQGARWENMQRLAFEELWSSINGAESWAANPWVWAVSFRRVEEASRG